jgi:DHA2 family multidrug resistance protein
MGEAMGHDSGRITAQLARLAGRMAGVAPDPRQATLIADGLFSRIVQREAMSLAFDDIFRLLAWMFVVALVMVPFCRPSANVAPPDVAH